MGLKRFILPAIVIGIAGWIISKWPEISLLVGAIALIIIIGLGIIRGTDRQ